MVTLVLVSLCAVCASTSVSAADGGSSRASVEASPNLVGGVAAGTGPSACILGLTNTNANLYLFAKGSDGALWYTNMSLVGEGKTWARWASLGGQLTSSPTVAMQKYCIELWVRGTNGYIYLNEFSSAWSGWTGGTMQGPPGYF